MIGKSINRINRFLIVGLIMFSVFCILAFTVMFDVMNKKSSETVEAVGGAYMEGISEQISQHFKTAIELRISQMYLLGDSLSDARNINKSHDEMHEELAKSCKTYDISYLSFVSADGDRHKVYGRDVTFYDRQSFLEYINRDEIKVGMATDDNGDNLIMISIPIKYPMSDEVESRAMMCGIPVSYIADTLSLEEDRDSVYSFIVRQDGSFVFRTKSVIRNNYFDRVRDLYETSHGKSTDDYLNEIQTAMSLKEDYESDFWIYGERRKLYMTPMDYTDWYLISFMPFGEINSAIDEFSDTWVRVAILTCIIILFALIFIFARFMVLNRQYISIIRTAQDEAEKANLAKSEFLSHMSHDIRTPMNAIVGMTEIAKKHIDDKAEVENCLEKIHLSSIHLVSLINDVLDMSKIESGKLTFNETVVSLNEVIKSIKNIVQVQADKKSLDLRVNVHDVECDNVMCDPVRLNQIIMNLVSNAIKFTPENGYVEIELSESESDAGGDYTKLQLNVRDNGIGMSEEFLAHIFDSFSREDDSFVRKIEGTGLGMAITKHIVSAMNGTIDVKSKQGQGSEFNVTLNLKKSEDTAAVSDADSSESGALSGKHILVAEDNELNREIAETILTEAGIKVSNAENGRICADMFEQSAHGEYDMILMDIRMPVMDGYAAASTIRAMDRPDAKTVPIVAMSADAFSDDVKHCMDVGMNAHISKPINIRIVTETLIKYMS